MKIIETERLYLRELTIEDTHDLSKVLSDPESMKYYPTPFSKEKVEQWIQWNRENYIKYGHGLWAVIRKEDERFIGDCGITMQTIENETVPEIGFHIMKEFCNKGYAIEAANACIKYAFSVVGYPKVYVYAALTNLPSRRVAEKMGMHVYKEFQKNGAKQIAYVTINQPMFH